MDNNEFIMEEVLTKDYGTPTIVTDEDMLMPIEDIKAMHQDDDLYDENWTPEPELENMMKDEGCLEEMCNFASESDHSDEDPCWDGYKQIGFKDKDGRHVPNCVKASGFVAAGGADRNRGNAEELRHYWTHGAGGAKIRWNTPGDWKRCVRHLEKYLGPRAKGYCQLRHKEMDGVYTGSHLNPGGNGHHGHHGHFSSLYSSDAELTERVISQSIIKAKIADAKQRVSLTAAAVAPTGAAFYIPMLVPEGVETGDGRSFEPNAIEVRDLPLPLLWQIKTGEGHAGSVVVGRIDSVDRIEGGIGHAKGVFDNGPYGREAQRLVENGFLRGVSADLDQFEAKEHGAGSENSEGDDEIGGKKLTINHARVMAATIVAKPAFQECTIAVNKAIPTYQEEDMIPEDGVYEESTDSFEIAQALTASGFLESEIPTTPPTEWFQKPALTKATPLTVTPEGKVFGHIAAWHVNHIGMPRATRPPRSRSKYAYFHTGVVRTAEGTDMPVGQLTLAGGHASLQADARAAAKHYDDTASAIADVHAGEDDYGIWVAGSLRPDATEAQIRALRASAPSGDWRPIGGSLELVAVCQVNVPGFPIARAMVAGGQVMALVAAGAHDMAILKSQAVATLSNKAQNFGDLAVMSEQILERAEQVFGYIPRQKREDYAKKGWALPDGSFPIKSKDDVKAAIHAYGRAKEEHKAAVRKHIIKRAHQLKVSDLIPEGWAKPKTIAASAQIDEMRERALVASAVAELASISEEERKDLAEKGYALPDGSYPIRNEADLKNAIKAYGRSNTKDRAKVRKHISKRARALGKADFIPEDWKTASSREVAQKLEDMRAALSAITAAGEAPAEAPNIPGASKEDIETLIEAKAAADKQTADEVKAAKQLHEDKVSGKLAEAAKKEAMNEKKGDKYAETGQSKYTPKTQPRDARGQYREVLARLSQHLGDAGLQDALQEAQSAQQLDFAGNYEASQKASADLLSNLDRLDSKALNPKDLANVKTTARDLGKVIANLPLPFGQDAQKLRFSDLPAGLQDLMRNMSDRVMQKIGNKDGKIATAKLQSYMSGGDYFNQGEVQSEMSKLLRLLT
jgi:hypothetical protein